MMFFLLCWVNVSCFSLVIIYDLNSVEVCRYLSGSDLAILRHFVRPVVQFKKFHIWLRSWKTQPPKRKTMFNLLPWNVFAYLFDTLACVYVCVPLPVRSTVFIATICKSFARCAHQSYITTLNKSQSISCEFVLFGYRNRGDPISRL